MASHDDGDSDSEDSDGEGGEAQYFSRHPTVRSQPTTVDLHLPDLSFRLDTDHGVFGRAGVDAGTKLLLTAGPEPTAGDRNLLDLGCGYGPIAVTLAARNPEAVVWAVDVNQRARDLCRANAERARLTNVRVIAPEDHQPDVGFDRLWSNPPIRVGKSALRHLLTTWLSRLNPGGSAHLVVQKHLGSDSLHRWLENAGWPTTRRRSQSAYRLLDVTAGPQRPAVDAGSDPQTDNGETR